MNAIILFFKNPRKGEVKSRLSKEIGEDKALGIYNQLLLSTLKTTESLKGKHDVFYYCDEEENVFDLENYCIEEGENLRERIKNAVDKALKTYKKVIVIASDCYDLTAADIDKAFDKLDDCEVVFGPAIDGGFYLLGMKREMDYLFETVPINSDSVLHLMIDELVEKNISYCLLETRIDVDTLNDLKHTDLNY